MLPERPKRGSSYVSPYRVGGGASNVSRSPVGSRNLSNNSQKNRFQYKSPVAGGQNGVNRNRTGISPGGSQGGSVNRNRFQSPNTGLQTTGNRVRPGQANNRFSPNASNNSQDRFNRTGGSRKGQSPSQSGTSNRLYSPSGRMRLSGSNNMGT